LWCCDKSDFTLPDKTLTVKLGKREAPVIENFDFGADYIIENPKENDGFAVL
jgi:hypothetical protein